MWKNGKTGRKGAGRGSRDLYLCIVHCAEQMLRRRETEHRSSNFLLRTHTSTCLCCRLRPFCGLLGVRHSHFRDAVREDPVRGRYSHGVLFVVSVRARVCCERAYFVALAKMCTPAERLARWSLPKVVLDCPPKVLIFATKHSIHQPIETLSMESLEHASIVASRLHN